MGAGCGDDGADGQSYAHTRRVFQDIRIRAGYDRKLYYQQVFCVQEDGTCEGADGKAGGLGSNQFLRSVNSSVLK